MKISMTDHNFSDPETDILVLQPFGVEIVEHRCRILARPLPILLFGMYTRRFISRSEYG